MTIDNTPLAGPASELPTSRRQLLAGAGLLATGVALSPTGASANTQAPLSESSDRANPHGRFAGKVILVTGATSGIGRTTAEGFAREGGKVMFCGRREELGHQVESGIRAFGGDAIYRRADVRDEAQVAALVDACVARYGRLDVAFNNAGVESSPHQIHEMPSDVWTNVLSTNANGVFFSMKHEIPVMLRQGGGVIVNTASVSGHAGFATISPYSASKHAIVSLTKVAALEYADKNIRVNAIAPGAVDTPMLRRAAAAWKTDYATIAKDYPVKRIVQPEEMARAVLFLASDDATSFVGTDLDVTGGYLAKG